MTQVLVRKRTRVAASLLLAVSLLLTGFATDHARAGTAAGDRGEMLQLTNDARERREIDLLRLDAKLSRYAISHSRAMADAGELFHTADLAAKLRGLRWSIGGENVGVARSLDDLQDAFMASKPHRSNILREGYDHTAIGVVQSDGKLWVTVIFYG
ncbi:MAG: CAP domain-containing protein [Actinomycetota bacterium]